MSLPIPAALRVATTYTVLMLMLLAGRSAHAQLKADFTPNRTSACNELIATFTDNSTGNPVSWQWDLGNGSTSTLQNASASYYKPSEYTVKLTVKNAAGATSTTEKKVTVWDKPKPDFTAAPPKGCVPFNVQFTDKSNPVNGSISTYSWDFGDGTVGSGANPSHTYTNAVSPTVTLTVTNSNGCTGTKQISNIVEAAGPLTANFSLSDKFLCIAPGAVTVTNTSTGPGNLTYKWDFGDGKTATGAAPGAHTYTAKGIYKITLTVTSDKGCTATKTSEEINVANFKTDFTVPASICENANATFTANVSPQPNNITWSADNGYFYNYGPTSTYRPGTAGTVKVTMTADYGRCNETVTKDFVVKPIPRPQFESDQVAICDVPATVKFTDKSTGATAWNWTFGDGQSSTQQNPSVTYSKLGYYTIQLNASNAQGCAASAYQYINVAKPEVYAYTSVSNGCEGITPTFSCYISTGDEIVKWEWDFGDGSPKSTAEAPSHTYAKAGIYPVRLSYTTKNGCKGTVGLYSYNDIRVYKKPKPDFSSPQAPQICGNNWVTFNATTDVGDSFYWQFGDNQPSGNGRNVAHSYRDPGTYSVTLTVSNNSCSETITKTNYIKAVNPFPRFALQQIDCDNRTEMKFEEQSIGTISSWKWNWGDGKGDTYTSKTTPVRHKYDRTGPYLVKLTVSDGTCTSTDSMNINIYAPSTITIAGDKSTLCGHETVKFNVTSIDKNLYPLYNYGWSSSDGTTAYWNYWDYQQTTFTNLKPGKDTIRFMAYNHQNCIDTSNFVVLDVHGPVAKFQSPPVLECRGVELTFTDQTDVSKGKPIKSWSFNFGDGNAAKTYTAPPFKYTYNKSGHFFPTMTVTDQDGCTSTATGDILQVNGPNAAFELSSSLIRPGGDVWMYNYTSETGGYPSYLWDFGDNTTSTDDWPVKNYPDKGTYTIKLLVKDDLGCSDSAKKQIKVSAVSANFSVSTSFVNNSGCPPVIARFNNTSVNYTSSTWDFGDGSTSTLAHPSHTYTYAGRYKVKLKVVGDAGTEDEFEEIVEVKGPFATIKTSSNGGCLSKEIEFTVDAIGAVNFAWDFTDGNVMETTDAVIKHTFKNPGIYKPRLILSDQAGCKGTAFLDDPIVVDQLDIKMITTPEFICGEGWVEFKPAFNSYSIDELKEEAVHKWTFETGLQAENETTGTPRFYLDQIKDYSFTLETTTAWGCTDKVTHIVHAYTKPASAITAVVQACEGSPVHFSGTLSGVTDAAWKWNFGHGSIVNDQQPADQTFDRSGLTEVALIVTSKDGCSDTASHQINIVAKPVVNAAAAAGVICQGNSTSLSAGGGITYEWSPATGLSDPSIAAPVADPRVSTTYEVKVTDANGCISNDAVSIRVAEPFRIQATPDTVICLGHVLPLRVSGADRYTWTGTGLDNVTAVQPRATITATGNYTYKVTGYDADNCFTHDTSLIVNVQPAPTVNAGADKASMAGTPVKLNAMGSTDIIRWNWTPEDHLDCTTCPTPMALPNLTTTYKVEVVNRFGCKASDEVVVMVACEKGSVFLPTAFTPNRDGNNDWFYPKGRGIKEVSWMRIYDRWGSLVFERMHFQLNNATSGWDGMWKNKVAPSGSYVYAIETLCEDGTPFIFRGTVLVIN